jgi:hypothetical protein
LHHSSLNRTTDCRSRLELESALKDLESRQQAIKPELEASLQFLLGQYDYASDLIDSALISYQNSSHDFGECYYIFDEYRQVSG